MKTASTDNPRSGITKAARHLLERGGISALSMRSIAKHLGVSAMMPYKHFPSKDHILMELRLEAFQRLTTHMRRAQAEAQTPTGALVAVSQAYVGFALKAPNDYRLMFDAWEFENYAQISADFGDSISREADSWHVNLDAVTAFAEAENLAIDCNFAAHWLWSSLHGMVQLHLSRKLAFGLEIQQLEHIFCEKIPTSIRAFSQK
ncbi:TetR/AcrR family transcriptional regulator [Phaeobacter inhibens]|uniref:TetR/AcrR family transcriptional regulator n=1 Tax=Phaeobacter inhibens TaxID=221822 RepID=UPI0021A71DD7|nr:TetR/AcrR family transcriptional regulator [Phaeobacter inhibens]UWR55537.1 TetR/AcrR family transcriptional regulator [Phaeobacter inhibens]UWR63618.1 TetR/AcrR family transcriptional regulator [Phaeobacter inhibens]